MAKSPIHIVEVLDFVHETKEGVVELFIVVRTPMEDRPSTTEFLREKIRFYLAQLNSEGFRAVFHRAPQEKTTIVLACTEPPPPGVGDFLARIGASVEEENARLEVRVNPQYFAFLCDPHTRDEDAEASIISGLRSVRNFTPARRSRRSEPWRRTCPQCSTVFSSVQRLGVCPSCGSVFEVDESGGLIRDQGRLGQRTVEHLDECASISRMIEKLTRAMSAQKITREEFFYSVLDRLVRSSERCWRPCLAIVPEHLAHDLRAYAESHPEYVALLRAIKTPPNASLGPK